MNFKAVSRGAMLSLLPAIMTLFVCALLIYFNILSEKGASIIVFATAMAGVFFGAFGVARTSEKRLLLNAFGVAFIFSLVVFITAIIVNGSVVFHTRTLTLIGGAFAASLLGAIFGK